MLVKDFVAMDKFGSLFQVVDATRTGYVSYPDQCTLITGDRNVVCKEFGEHEVVGIAPKSRRALLIFIQ